MFCCAFFWLFGLGAFDLGFRKLRVQIAFCLSLAFFSCFFGIGFLIFLVGALEAWGLEVLCLRFLGVCCVVAILFRISVAE